jgi:hypothetical protein
MNRLIPTVIESRLQCAEECKIRVLITIPTTLCMWPRNLLKVHNKKMKDPISDGAARLHHPSLMRYVTTATVQRIHGLIGGLSIMSSI